MEKINITPDKFENICRTCLTESNLESLFSKNNNFPIDKMLMAIAQVNIEITDGMPTKICHSCINTLKVAFNFKQQSESVDLKLREILSKYSSKNSENDFKFEIASVNSANDPSDDDYECTNKNENNLDVLNEEKTESIAIKDVKLDEIANKKETVYCATDICDANFKNNDICSNNATIVRDGKQIKNENENKVQLENSELFSKCAKITITKNNDQEKGFYSNDIITNNDQTETDNDSQMQVQLKNIQDQRIITEKCHICHKEINSKGFQLHLQTHFRNVIFTCEICGQTFHTKPNYARHMKIHSGERPYKCETCGKAFIQSCALKEHKRCHTDERPFECKFCGKKYKRYDKLPKHLRKYHSDLNPFDFECTICKKGFASRLALNTHSRVHWVKRYDCPECNKRFNSRHLMESHLETHRNPIKKVKVCNNPYLCNFCGKVFFNKSLLAVHLRVHTQERPFSCSFCPKVFKTKYGLRDHENGHTGIRPFACDECGRTFRQSFHLVAHKRTHTGEKPYKCTICDKAFTLRKNMKFHLNTHTGNTPYICAICEKGFYYSNGLQKHLKKYHNTENKN